MSYSDDELDECGATTENGTFTSVYCSSDLKTHLQVKY